MAKVTIANLNTLLDDVVTSNIAVQTAQSAVTNATVQAANAAISAQAAALSKSQIDQQVTVISGLADDINADVLAATVIKDAILALEEAIRLDADQVTLDKAAVTTILGEVLTAKSGVDVKAELIEELVEDFHTKYLGASLEAPNASWEGMELATGMLYYDIAKKSLMIWVDTNVWKPIIEAVNVLLAANNLSDILDKAIARTNLDVMSTSEVEAQIQADIAAIKGQPLGLAELDAAGLVPASQLPSYVDDVIEVATYADLPVVGESGKIYVVVADETSGGGTNSYRWTGTTYARISNSLTAADVKSLYESNADANAYTDAEQVKVGYITVTQAVDLDTIESDTILNNSHRTSNGTDHTYIDQDVTTTATPTFAGIVTNGLVDGRDVSVDGLKLDGIEVGATADQTATEIEALYEGLADTNKYTDAEKLSVDVSTTLNTTATTLPTAINEIHGEVDAHLLDTSVHGVTEVVGMIETQTLTNKTIDNISNLIGADHIHYKVRNASGSTIAIDTVVTASGTQPGTDYIQVIPVTDPQTQIALGITHTELLNNGIGLVMNTGVHNNANTSAWTVGTLLYPNTAGGLTSTKPTSGRYQACAVVLRQHSSSGTLLCEFTEPKLFGSTTQAGYVQLNNTLTSNSVTEALTSAQGKVLKDILVASNVERADKYLAAQNIANMVYAGDNLTKIQYNTATDIDYEVLTYGVDGLSNIAHYVGGVLAGNTVLTYAAGDLVSAVYTGV